MNNDKKEFYIRKQNIARCFVAENDGQLRNVYNSGFMNYSVGDWVCYDPNDITDIWVIVKNLHQNYTILTEEEKRKEAKLRKK